MSGPPPAKFTLDEAQAAADTWGCNCGPGAIAAICGLTLDEARPHLGDFERKKYTNPTLMWAILNSIGARWRCDGGQPRAWPRFGLARVQWEGPWTQPGVPMVARYRHTHWVGSWRDGNATQIFDINAMCVGGWLPLSEWAGQLVPWLLRECVRRADGQWHLTHRVEIAPTAAAARRE